MVFRQKVNANWLQAVETTMDSAHLGVLHQSWLKGFGDIEYSSANMAPVYHVAQEPFGFRYAAVRALKDERFYVRTNAFVMPWYGIVSPNQTDVKGGSAFFSVPIDDEHIWYWQITYRTNGPLCATQRTSMPMPTTGRRCRQARPTTTGGRTARPCATATSPASPRCWAPRILR